mgnify:CR=1 FL=1
MLGLILWHTRSRPLDRMVVLPAQPISSVYMVMVVVLLLSLLLLPLVAALLALTYMAVQRPPPLLVSHLRPCSLSSP